MSGHDLDRVRADLATMRNALGVDLPYGEADVWFCAAMAASGGVYAVLTWPNSPVEVTSAWSALPIFAAIGAYVLYLAVKSRRLPPREGARRREYKSGLIAVAVIVPATIAYAKWAKYAGLTPTQGGGCLTALMGATMFLIGVAMPPARYPRSLLIAPSLPLIAFGAFIPLAAPDYCHCLIGLMDMVAVGQAALIEYRHIHRRLMEGENHVGN